ncbi:MAG: tetratricopeptide repeat protein, partial [Blastocatellia bacterium]
MAIHWQIGDQIQNRWEINKILTGGMGVVYVVYDNEWHEVLAAKTFQEEAFLRRPEIADRFNRESRAWINLDAHENITMAKFVRIIHGKPFLFMEYVSGGDLCSWIGTHRLTKDLRQVLRFAIQFCDGMLHALAKGLVVHRDIKPQNCLVTENRTLKVTDFGLAKVLDDLDYLDTESRDHGHDLVQLSATGKGAGTCTHMAPEQFDDAKGVDVHADIYSFGIMLYQMVTGRLPFDAQDWLGFADRHKNAQVPPMDWHEGLAEVVRRCLEKVPARRYSEFNDVRDRLADIYRQFTGEEPARPTEGLELSGIQLLNKAGSLTLLGKGREAIVYCDRGLALDPNSADLWSVKGAALDSLSKPEEALLSFDRALALNPLNILAWSNKGRTLELMGRREEALGCFDRALALNPYDEVVLSNKGHTLNGMTKQEQALECLDRAIASNPLYEKAWNNKGKTLDELGRPEEALRCYDEGLAIHPRSAELWSNRGVALIELGNAREALECYDRALALNPCLVGVLINKGNALADLGKLDEAFDCLN